MARLPSVFILIVILLFSILLFELQNVWPFNQDRVPALRMLFASSTVASLVFHVVGKWWITTPFLLASGFVLTSANSSAELTAAFIGAASFLVVIAGILSWATRQKAYLR